MPALQHGVSSLAEGIFGSDGVLPGEMIGSASQTLWFRVQGEHPSEAVDCVKVLSFSPAFLPPFGFTTTCHTLKVKTCCTVF